MLICPNPKCKKRYFKRHQNSDGSIYYHCSSCGYEKIAYYPKGVPVFNTNKTKRDINT